MKRHSDKKFIDSGVVQQLLTKKFISNDKTYIFDYWNYERNVLQFCFKEENTDNNQVLAIQLYYQHTNDYKNTLDLLYKCFDKVENKIKQINLKEIKDETLLDIIDEYLFNDGIVTIEDHYESFFDRCSIGTDYKFMYNVDIEIFFEESGDEDYPIKVMYETTYTNSRVTIDYIQRELYNKAIGDYKNV